MKKNILLTVLLVFLMVMNAVLLFLILDKPDEKRRPPRKFITAELGFSEAQQIEFAEIDREHHRAMRRLDRHSRDLKELLFSKLDDTSFHQNELDSITGLIGQLSEDREREVFSYFRKVSKICNEKQKLKLERMLFGALKHGPRPEGPPPPHR
ncbi:hypothetical protein [Flagellimonas flava]|uniref:Heavy-metal resistance n=1 Tax=Flagellimonas flava TaxID=570519 RepID=A0A1M5N845_9FLAO|nr:hypothetical protein [Allomuricauda flava]SHG85720.1 hypothetical protein SAMN04488116_2712 [Allomuricauda flava]